MPTGPLGFPRLTDLMPLASYHRDSPSSCDIKECYNGLSKQAAAEDVLRLYRHVYTTFPEKLSGVGVVADTVVLVGSTVRGDFGCRELKKIQGEVMNDLEMFYMGGYVDEAKRMMQNSSTTAELRQKIQEKIDTGSFSDEEEEFFWDELLMETCSDMDIFALIEAREREKS